MAAMLGFGPKMPESKSGVLPLHHIAMFEGLISIVGAVQKQLNAPGYVCLGSVLQLDADCDGATGDNASFLERLAKCVTGHCDTVDHD